MKAIARAPGAAALALVVLVCAPGVSRAQGSTTWSAPYPCASDEFARRTGVLITGAPHVIPYVPMVTHGCVESHDWVVVRGTSHICVALTQTRP